MNRGEKEREIRNRKKSITGENTDITTVITGIKKLAEK